MYQMFPSQMMQIMNSPYQSAQTHTLHINSINGLHQTDFASYGIPDISGYNRHQAMQVYI